MDRVDIVFQSGDLNITQLGSTGLQSFVIKRVATQAASLTSQEVSRFCHWPTNLQGLRQLCTTKSKKKQPPQIIVFISSPPSTLSTPRPSPFTLVPSFASSILLLAVNWW